jgi:DNA polymerase (family 10)
MECNASPERLDLKDTHLRMAKERGVKIVISTDAHTTRGLLAMRYGVQMARRGWIEKKDVINTLSLEKLLAGLREKPGAAHGKHRAAAASARPSSKPRRSV